MNEELEPNVMDYMLFFVLVRSESHEKMQYQHLIEMLDQIIEGMQKQRIQSADRKNRPESASPETMKKRNLSQKSGPSHHEAAAENGNQIEEEEDYPEEEIAVDPDEYEEDDGTERV